MARATAMARATVKVVPGGRRVKRAAKVARVEQAAPAKAAKARVVNKAERPKSPRRPAAAKVVRAAKAGRVDNPVRRVGPAANQAASPAVRAAVVDRVRAAAAVPEVRRVPVAAVVVAEAIPSPSLVRYFVRFWVSKDEGTISTETYSAAEVGASWPAIAPSVIGLSPTWWQRLRQGGPG